jgi:hypothetical protein
MYASLTILLSFHFSSAPSLQDRSYLSLTTWVESSSKMYASVLASRSSLLINSQALTQSKNAKYKPGLLPVYEATYGIIFMSVPHRGSNWDSLAKRMSALVIGSADVPAVRGLDVNSETLERLRADFAILLKDDTFWIHTFQETEDMVGIPGLRGMVRISSCPMLSSLIDTQSRSLNLSRVSSTMLVSRFRHCAGTTLACANSMALKTTIIIRFVRLSLAICGGLKTRLVSGQVSRRLCKRNAT